jgi:hypothetical protein
MNPQQLIVYINQMHEWAQGCCAPLFYRDATFAQHSGSMTFVDTGQELLGITAGHVADGVINYCDGSPGHGCQVGSADLDPGRLIARHHELDLATFRLSTPFITTARHHSVSVPQWPPRAPVVGETMLFGGYPAMYRKQQDRQIEVAFLYFASRVDSASDRHFGMALEIADSYSHGYERVPANADLGGWSGGCVFRVIEDEVLARLELTGIIYEYSPALEIVFAHPVSCVGPDGTFTS